MNTDTRTPSQADEALSEGDREAADAYYAKCDDDDYSITPAFLAGCKYGRGQERLRSEGLVDVCEKIKSWLTMGYPCDYYQVAEEALKKYRSTKGGGGA